MSLLPPVKHAIEILYCSNEPILKRDDRLPAQYFARHPDVGLSLNRIIGWQRS